MIWPTVQPQLSFNEVAYNWAWIFEALLQAVFFLFSSLFWRYFYSLGYKCKKNQFCPLCKGFLECVYWHHDWQSQHILNSEYIYILFIEYVPLQSKHKLCITWENAILVSNGIYKISRNILILHSKFVKFPEPTYFQCVYYMSVLRFTLDYKCRPLSDWN